MRAAVKRYGTLRHGDIDVVTGGLEVDPQIRGSEGKVSGATCCAARVSKRSDELRLAARNPAWSPIPKKHRNGCGRPEMEFQSPDADP